MKKTIYKPKTGSVAYRAIVLFKRQPEGARLTSRQLRNMLGVGAKNICSLLAEPVEQQVLIVEKEGNTSVFSLGKGEVCLPDNALEQERQAELNIERAFAEHMLKTKWAPTINPLPLPMRDYVTTQTGAQA